MSNTNPIETRARELMLDPADKAAYMRLMGGDRGDYHVYCPGCQVRLDTYETTILRHVRTCVQLRTENK